MPTMPKQTVLVVGAKPHGLGSYVATLLALDFTVIDAGISGESVSFDISSDYAMHRLLLEHTDPLHIVCTVGINKPLPNEDMALGNWYREHFDVNVIGPMRLLEAWLDHLREKAFSRADVGDHHYVVISSNSAHIARTSSEAYCASKAALSMALRCRARRLGRDGFPEGVVAYGYEPGMLYGTPMTEYVRRSRIRRVTVAEGKIAKVERRPVMHRMPGVGAGGLDPLGVAEIIGANLRNRLTAPMLNGTLLRLDAGEQ